MGGRGDGREEAQAESPFCGPRISAHAFPTWRITQFLFEKLILFIVWKMTWSRHFVDLAFRLMRFPPDGELDFYFEKWFYWLKKMTQSRHLLIKKNGVGCERKAIQLPRSDMSESSDSAYPESIRSRQFRFPRQLGSSDTRDSLNPFSPTIKKQILIMLKTKSPEFFIILK